MIHKTAIVDPNSKISSNVEIGPYSVIGPNVEVGENTIIQSHVSIVGNTKIGKKNKIYPFASIGNDPQDLKFNGESTKLEIGDNNKIREYVTINPGTKGGGGITKIGNGCLFMVSSHIAHDCLVEDNVILANNVPLGGHACPPRGTLFASITLSSTKQSCAMCEETINKHPLPILVIPPPPLVPGFIVTYSLILLLSPISNLVLSPLNFRS